MYAHGSSPPPAPTAAVPDLPPQFDAVVARAMAKEPDDRYLSACDLGRAARAAAEDRSLSRAERSVATGDAAPADATTVAGPAPATPGAAPTVHGPAATAPGAAPIAAGAAPTAAAPPPATARRGRLLSIAAAVLGLAVIAVVAVLLLGGGNDEPRLSKADYEDQVSDTLRALQTAGTRSGLPGALPNVSDERLKVSNALGRLQDAYTKAAEDLAAVRPPEAVADLHRRGLTAIRAQGDDIGAAEAAADRGDAPAYRAGLAAYERHNDDLAEIGQQYRERGYARLGATPGNATGRPVTGEEREAASVVFTAQTAFRDKDVAGYCATRSQAYMAKAYGGSNPFESCKKAGRAGLEAEIPALLNGGDLTLTGVSIEGGESGERAVVTATGDGGAKVNAVVTRDVPRDDVWRVDSLSGG
jgi:hypothetical protein